MEKQIPYYEYKEYFEKRNDYALLIPTWNEGERIRIELNRSQRKRYSFKNRYIFT